MKSRSGFQQSRVWKGGGRANLPERVQQDHPWVDNKPWRCGEGHVVSPAHQSRHQDQTPPAWCTMARNKRWMHKCSKLSLSRCSTTRGGPSCRWCSNSPALMGSCMHGACIQIDGLCRVFGQGIIPPVEHAPVFATMAALGCHRGGTRFGKK